MEVHKTVEGCLRKITYDCCLSLSLHLQIQEALQFKVYTSVTSFNMYLNFWEWVLSKTQNSGIYIYIYIYIYVCIYIYIYIYMVSTAYSITFWKRCCKGHQISGYSRFSFAVMKKKMLDFSFFMSVRYIVYFLT